jgi:hypothetical protein
MPAAGRALLDDSDNTAQRSTLGLAIGSDVQAYNARLADIAWAAWAQGDIAYHNGSNLVRLAAGTSGQFLKTQGAAANPIWADVTGIWIEIGDTTLGSAVASVETTFTAGTYSRILVVVSGLSSASTNVTLNITLRHSGGAIVTLTGTGTGAGNFDGSGHAVFDIDLVAATKRHVGHLVAYHIAGADHLVAQGSNATAPDRVRVAFSSGNIDTGRIIVYGLTA